MICDSQGCGKQAAGAVGVEIFPHRIVARLADDGAALPMTKIIMALYACPDCFKALKLPDVIPGPALETYYRVARLQNAGLVPDRQATRLALTPLDDPQLRTLTQTIERAQSLGNE